MVKKIRLSGTALTAIAFNIWLQGSSLAIADSATDAAKEVYALRSNACESVRITLLSCVPAEGDRGEICDKAVHVLMPSAFDDLRSSVQGDAGKLGKIDAFQQRTEERLSRIASEPEESGGALNGSARNEATQSRTECFSLIDELE